jgi:hypothetical protein
MFAQPAISDDRATRRRRLGPVTALLVAALAGAPGCGRPVTGAAAPPPSPHEHRPPHGGTAVVLGDEAYHVELVRDAAAGKLQAYVFDGELENFVRSPVPALTLEATVNGTVRTLVLPAVASPATGETVGDTSLFEAEADWLKATPNFDATLRSITIRGRTFTGVRFNFPHGNDPEGAR